MARALVAMVALIGIGLITFPAAAQVQQAARDWQPDVERAAFPEGQGPRMLIDGGHGNFHKADGRYAPFAALMRADGYRVGSLDGPITDAALAEADILVIANALKDGEDAAWHLPTPSAFTEEEMGAIERWVANGGSLLLIADHMPFPGAAAELARAFGIIFVNGFARSAIDGDGTWTAAQADGRLPRHPVTEGRDESETVPALRVFSGQAFRTLGPVDGVITMPDDWVIVLPSEAWEFAADTPTISAQGMLQGATLRHGEGRVAIFGEAAMFTAQTIEDETGIMRIGLNDPEAPYNAQFALNVAHWLSGLLD